MSTNRPDWELFGDRGVAERTDNLSPNTGLSKEAVVVRIADGERPNWHIAFPDLAEMCEYDEYRS